MIDILKTRFYISIIIGFFILITQQFQILYAIYFAWSFIELILEPRSTLPPETESSINNFRRQDARLNIFNLFIAAWVIISLLIYLVINSFLFLVVSWLLFILSADYLLNMIIFRTQQNVLYRYLMTKKGEDISPNSVSSLARSVLWEGELSNAQLKSIFNLSSRQKLKEDQLNLYNLALKYIEYE